MIIAGGTIVTFDEKNRILEDYAILVEDNIIKKIERRESLIKEYSKEEVVEAKDCIIMPGLICAHSHIYSAFARGMPLKTEPPKNFVEILERIWWHLDKRLTLEDTYYSGLVTAIEAIKHGTTTLVDHHASPYSISGSLEKLATAMRQVGIRGVLAYEVSDRDGKDKAQEGINENVNFIKKYSQDDLIRGSFGLHASFTLSSETLKDCVNACEGLNVGFHIHVAEDRADVDDSIKKYGKRVVERLFEAGILGSKTIAAHCIHVYSNELSILKKTNTKVVHNPESNMNNAVGVARVLEMIHMGINPCLGTDGFTVDMFREAKVTYILHKIANRDPRVMGADQVLSMLTTNNSTLLAEYFEKKVGVIEPGAYADIIILDYKPYTPLTSGNFPWHFIFGIDSSHVKTVIVNGKLIMKDRKILTVNEDEIMAKAKEVAVKLWERL